jgi:hypothetical protein
VSSSKRCAGALVALLALSAGTAAAHTRSTSYSRWDLDASGADVSVRTSRLELTRLGLDPLSAEEDSQRVAALLAAQVRLSAGGEPCAPRGAPRRGNAPEGDVLYTWRVDCAGTGPRTIESTFLLDVAPSHLHFARVVRGDAPPVEKVLTEAEPTWALPEAGAAAGGGGEGTTLLEYVRLGIEHILTGWDHLAFVIGLLLLAHGLRDIATLVTSFTLAHSVTLALAVLGVVQPRGPIVEALIGFSIALVAIENTWLLAGRGRALPLLVVGALAVLSALGSPAVPRQAFLGLTLFTACHFALLRRSAHPERLRAAVAFAFGLIHGFGFAGVMMALDLGRVRLVPALFGFNSGVELGQLAVVCASWPVLSALRRRTEWGALSAEVGSAAVCALGLFWFATRAFA